MYCAVRRIGAIWIGTVGGAAKFCLGIISFPNGTAIPCTFSRRLTAPEDVEHLTVRYTFRWSIVGSSEWQLPHVIATDVAESYKPVKICVATGRRADRDRRFESIQDNVDLYFDFVPRDM